MKGAKLALEDAGITKADVDGLITCPSFVELYMYGWARAIRSSVWTADPGFHARLAQAHMHAYGTTSEQLALVSDGGAAIARTSVSPRCVARDDYSFLDKGGTRPRSPAQPRLASASESLLP